MDQLNLNGNHHEGEARYRQPGHEGDKFQTFKVLALKMTELGLF